MHVSNCPLGFFSNRNPTKLLTIIRLISDGVKGREAATIFL